MTPRKPMRMVAVRVPGDLWDAAKVAADAREEAIADVVRSALERYVKDARRKSPGVASNQDSEGV